MSLVFSNPTLKSGIVERLDRKVGTDQNPLAYPIAEKVSDINAARDAFTRLALRASGKWQFDDANHAEQPIISADLIAGQRDYTFDTDGEGSFIVEVERVMVSDQNKFFRKIMPVDPQSEDGMGLQQFFNNQNVQGIPYRYDKTGNVLSLDPIPSFNMRLVQEGLAGIKMYVARESTYYAATDLGKASGFPGLLDEYLVIHPAYAYASRNNLEVAGGVLKNGQRTGYLREVYEMEAVITEFFGNRAQDERVRFIPRLTRFK